MGRERERFKAREKIESQDLARVKEKKKRKLCRSSGRRRDDAGSGQDTNAASRKQRKVVASSHPTSTGTIKELGESDRNYNKELSTRGKLYRLDSIL